MSGIDFAAIKVGDKVKIGYRGLVSEDWAEVLFIDHASLRLSTGWTYLRSESVNLIAHQPAPRKVEVTLGEPLTRTERAYREPSWSSLSVARLVTNDDALYVATGEGSTVLTSATARRLALDILATVGVEE